jgi:hypothetical protein
METKEQKFERLQENYDTACSKCKGIEIDMWATFYNLIGNLSSEDQKRLANKILECLKWARKQGEAATMNIYQVG